LSRSPTAGMSTSSRRPAQKKDRVTGVSDKMDNDEKLL